MISRKLETAKFKELIDLLVFEIGDELRAFLDPSIITDPSDYLAAGKKIIRMTDSDDVYSRFDRSFSNEDLKQVALRIPNGDDKSCDARWLGTFVVEKVNRDRMLYGLDNFLVDRSYPKKTKNINFNPRMYDHLRKYVIIKINNKLNLSAADPSFNEIWKKVTKIDTDVQNKYVDNEGNLFNFTWKVEKGTFEDKEYMVSFNSLSSYFFKSESETIDFTNLRRTKEKGTIYVNAKLIGIVAFLIIDSIITVYSNALLEAEKTLQQLEETDPLEPNWIIRNLESGKWGVGTKFNELLDHTEPVNSWSHMKEAVKDAINDISNKDKTGWFTKIYRFMSSNSKHKPIQWIIRIFAGLPYEPTVKKLILPKSHISTIRSEKQLTSIKNEFLYAIDTIENYVGPNTIEPSWKWRAFPNLTSKPNLDLAFINGGGWFRILNEKEINFLVKIRNSVLTNNFMINASLGN
ncbi:MAG: hypothetical protein HeimC2_39710 [Candidatus Heimdallarchaeota archaeon LC_2]|nr:MAG: hypothetical protein HeimC2_39710 [Candidatus Heimdallarchaeota archaeon LC_2]